MFANDSMPFCRVYLRQLSLLDPRLVLETRRLLEELQTVLPKTFRWERMFPIGTFRSWERKVLDTKSPGVY